MFIKNIEERRFNATRASMNTQSCREFLVVPKKNPEEHYTLSCTTTYSEKLVHIRTYNSQEEAEEAFDDLMLAIAEDRRAWNAKKK